MWTNSPPKWNRTVRISAGSILKEDADVQFLVQHLVTRTELFMSEILQISPLATKPQNPKFTEYMQGI
jgi:hypothetical protein